MLKSEGLYKIIGYCCEPPLQRRGLGGISSTLNTSLRTPFHKRTKENIEQGSISSIIAYFLPISSMRHSTVLKIPSGPERALRLDMMV